MKKGRDTRRVAGQNGFGRFGLNLLWTWFDDQEAPYRIAFLNDEVLSPEQMLRIIKTDKIVQGFRACKVSLVGSTLLLRAANGREERVIVSHGPAEEAPWLGEPDIFLECSGARTASELCQPFLLGNTKVVIISATSYDSDGIFLSGYNHRDWKPGTHRIISYGSCTVNPGVNLAAFFNKAYGVKALAVDVIHNVQEYKLASGEFKTLQRKHCTLETIAPQFLPFLTKDNFKVNYTVVPWEGASIVDYKFRLKKPPAKKELLRALKKAIGSGGPLEGLFGMVAKDTGPETHLLSPYSAVIVESHVEMAGDTAHLFCYFYNEGTMRYHELASHIAKELRKR